MSSLKSDKRKRLKMVVKNKKSQLLTEKAKIVTVNLIVVKFFIINATQLLLSSSENFDYELNCD